MVKLIYQVVWTKRSQQHLKASYKYICEDSPQNALKVIEDIVEAMNKAVSNPEFTIPTNIKLIMMAATGLLKNTVTG